MLSIAKPNHDSTTASRQQHNRHSLADLVLSKSTVTGEDHRSFNYFTKRKEDIA